MGYADPAESRQPLVSPIHPACVYTFPDIDAIERFYSGAESGHVYARDGHPNADRLASQLTHWHAAEWGQVCSSGMAAISATVLPILLTGDRILISDRLYGKTTQLLRAELSRFGVRGDTVDVTDLDAVREALTQPTRLMFVESVSNPLCRVADVPALARLTREHGARLIVDNTFCTPMLMRPLELGADLVIESLTKMIGGHSDLTLGFVAGRDSDLGEAIRATISTWGFASNPFDCWLAERGLLTLDLRVRAATQNAARLAAWLRERSEVVRVMYPGLDDHPDHEQVGRLLPQGCGSMLAFEVEGGQEGVNRFMRAAPGIPFSPSLGHSTTTCSHPWSTSHRPDAPAVRRRQGISEGLIRLSVGVEPYEVIQHEMERGLAGVASVAESG